MTDLDIEISQVLRIESREINPSVGRINVITLSISPK